MVHAPHAQGGERANPRAPSASAKRIDPHDGVAYTRDEFLEFYEGSTDEWDLAEPVAAPAERAEPTESRGSRKASAEMSRAAAESLAYEWYEAKRARDYNAADEIRSRLRAVGYEATDLYEEIELFGWSAPDGAVSASSADAARASSAPANIDEVAHAESDDPLGYREHRDANTKALFAPTSAAVRGILPPPNTPRGFPHTAWASP